MYIQSRNLPSLLFSSILSSNFSIQNQLFQRLDPSRCVIFPPAAPPLSFSSFWKGGAGAEGSVVVLFFLIPIFF